MAGSQIERTPGTPPTHEAVEAKPWDFMLFQGQVAAIYKEHDTQCEYGPDTMFSKLVGNGWLVT